MARPDDVSSQNAVVAEAYRSGRARKQGASHEDISETVEHSSSRALGVEESKAQAIRPTRYQGSYDNCRGRGTPRVGALAGVTDCPFTRCSRGAS